MEKEFDIQKHFDIAVTISKKLQQYLRENDSVAEDVQGNILHFIFFIKNTLATLMFYIS
jgi:hypothetical protein